ncbi:MAG TPA: hypothetical protein PK523_00145 [Elusimicrobiales bacterium]|nr:hypothetical protein [Elusimicrobiales bacterium]
MKEGRYIWREAALSDWPFLVSAYDDVADPAIGQHPFNQALKPQFEAKRMPLATPDYAFRLRYYYIIEKRGEGMPLGILINSVNPEEKAEEFGIVLPKASQRRGIGSTVLKDFIEWRFPQAASIRCLVPAGTGAGGP